MGWPRLGLGNLWGIWHQELGMFHPDFSTEINNLYLQALVYVGRRPSFSAPERGQAWKMPAQYGRYQPQNCNFHQEMQMNMGFWCFGEVWDWFWPLIFGNKLLFPFSGHAAYHNLCCAHSYVGWYSQIRTEGYCCEFRLSPESPFLEIRSPPRNPGSSCWSVDS